MAWIIKNKKVLTTTDQELKILEEEIIATCNFLRSNSYSCFGGKKNVPIYLLLGPSRFEIGRAHV